MTLNKLFKLVEESREFAKDLLVNMISLPTVNPPGENYLEFCGLFKEVLNNIGLKTEIKRVPDEFVKKHLSKESWNYPRYIVVAKLGEGRPILHFNGHYDVVPPGTGWKKTDPFKPRIIGDLIYGRGATDMKGGLTSIVTAVKAIIESNIELNGCLEISATPDEETGGETGVGYMVENELVSPDYAIIAEPSGIDNIYFGHKGAVWLKVTIYGKQAHGSTPWLGINAFEKTAKVVNYLVKELKPKLSKKVSKYETIDPRGRTATINIGGVVSGGAKINIVPGEVWFTIDRRIIPEEEIDEAINEIKTVLEKAKREDSEIEYKIDVLGKLKPCITPIDSKIIKALSNSIKKTLKRPAKLTMCIGGLDMRYFVKKGVETVTYGPGEVSVAHMADEYVRIDSLIAVSKVYASTILNVLK